jgi:hypothetical protein
MLRELTQPKERSEHFHRATHELGIMGLSILVFLGVLFIGTILLRLTWGNLSTGLGIFGGICLYIWLKTGVKHED